MGKSKAKEVAPDDDDEALEEDTSIEGKWSLEERQRVAERIEASGTPLGLPDAAFDAPSMVQDAYDAMIQKSPGVEVMMEAILQAARRMDAENWQRFQQIPLLHVHQDDSTVHSNLFAQNEPSWRPLLQRPKKRKQSCAFLHMGTAPMTPVLADFLTKLGWSGICVGPMKPPPGNEDLLQFVQLDPAEAKDQFQIDELLGETGGLVPSPPTFPLAFVNVLFNVNEDSSLLDPYDDDYEEKLKERQEQEAAEAEAKKATGKKKKKDTVVQENAELPPVPPSTVAGYGVVGLTRGHRVRRRLRAIKNCLAITLGRLAKDGSLVMVWPGLPLHPVLFFIAGSLRKLFQRVHVFSPEGSKTFEVYILAAGYKRDKADSKVPGMGGLEIRSFFEDTWRCDGLDDVLLWTLAPLEEDEETNIGLTGKSSVMSYTQLWKTWGTKLTSLALDLGMLLGQDDGAAAAMVKKGSKGTPPTRSKKAKAKEKPKVKQPKAVAVSEEPSIRHFDASQSLGSTADAVSTASPATAPVQAPPAASQPPPTAEAAAAPAESVAPVGPAETGASASAAATPAAPQATSTEPQSTQPPTAELPAGPTPAGPAGVRRRAAPGTRLPPMQDGDPLESELAPRKRRFMLKRGLPALSCSLGAAPGHKYRRPDYQELANQHPLIHKALEVARHGKQKHWDLDGEESNGPRGSIAWNLEDGESGMPHPTSGSKGGPHHSAYYGDIAHLCSLLHAVALQHLRADSNLDNLEFAYPEATHLQSVAQRMDMYGMPSFSRSKVGDAIARQTLPVLGGLRPEERLVLEADSQGNLLSTDARVAMVEGWFMRRLIGRQKFEQGESSVTSPPILSRLYQVISDGTLWFGAASKVAITPFPFPYHNIISVFLWMYTLMAPVLINGIIMDTALRSVFVFTSVFCYHALHHIGDNLEDPYLPYDPNELPLPDLQHSVNMRLWAFGVVPAPEAGPKGEKGENQKDVKAE